MCVEGNSALTLNLQVVQLHLKVPLGCEKFQLIGSIAHFAKKALEIETTAPITVYG
jgi:hypothetical protein